MFYYSEYDSPVGRLTLASDGSAVCGLWIEGQKYHGSSLPAKDKPSLDDAAPGIPELHRWLDEYFAGNRPDPSDVPLAPIGSDFRQAVWRKLLEIPYGQLTTYGKISEALKSELGKSSAIAVGGAVGHNPISIIIPCHRVVGSDRSLTGYAGGLDRKTWLLRHEGLDVANGRIR